MWFLNRTCLTIRAGTWVGLVYVPRSQNEMPSWEKFQSMAISWVQSDLQSWIIVQPKTSDCQLNTGESFQISIKIRKSKLGHFFFKEIWIFSHNYKFKNSRKEFYVKPLNRHQYQKKSVCLIVWHYLYFSSISKLKFPHGFFKHIWNYNAA